MFEIIKGIDGTYVAKGGKLVKITKVNYSENYFLYTGKWKHMLGSSNGWVEYILEDGQVIRIG